MPLACTDIRVGYGRRTAIEGVSLSLRRGEIRALIGPNGSGKSTALHALAGLIVPSAGAVEIDGPPLRGIARRALARRLAFLPQQPAAPEEMTVERLALQGRFAHVGLLRGYRAADHQAVRWALESTGLAGLAARPLRELSGGERQRAWIAAALAQEAEILLLDEPTSFLDIGHQAEVLDLLVRLAHERGVTVAMAIHDIDQAMRWPTALPCWRRASSSSTALRTTLQGVGWSRRSFVSTDACPARALQSASFRRAAPAASVRSGAAAGACQKDSHRICWRLCCRVPWFVDPWSRRRGGTGAAWCTRSTSRTNRLGTGPEPEAGDDPTSQPGSASL